MKKILLFATFLLTLNAVIAQPIINSFSPTSGAIGTLLTITGTGLNNPVSLEVGGVSAVIVSKADNKLVCLVMPNTTNGSVNITTTTGSFATSNNFTVTNNTSNYYPQQGDKLIGNDYTLGIRPGSAGKPCQGSGLAISADGNTAVVGGFLDNDGIGALWVYTRNGSNWVQQGSKLVPSDYIGNQNSNGATIGGAFAIGISADGNTIVAGGNGDNYLQGATWIFTRNGGNWRQQGKKIVDITSTAKGQGRAVAISADGNTIIVGCWADNGSIGSARIYNRKDTVWRQQGSKLIGTGYVAGGSGTIGAYQGWSVALSADGNTALVGGYADNRFIGAAWVFVRTSDSIWTQQGSKLVGNDYKILGPQTYSNSVFQGNTVALSADGNTAMIGGNSDSGGRGAVWVFTRINNVWAQYGSKFVAISDLSPTQTNNQLTLSNMSADGTTVVCSGNNADNTSTLYLFRRSGNKWNDIGANISGSNRIGGNTKNRIGRISSDGSTLIVGNQDDDNYIGAAWVFTPMLTTLPLKFLSFNASLQNDSILLYWKTTQEINTSHFLVQRSLDGNNFETIGKIIAKGDGSYSFVDNALPIGNKTLYFRLQCLDKDRSSAYSKIEEVTIKPKLAFLKLYPNPVKSALFIQLSNTNEETVILKIIDLQGKEVLSQSKSLKVGINNFTLNTDALQKGSYTLLVIGELVQKKSFIKD